MFVTLHVHIQQWYAIINPYPNVNELNRHWIKSNDG